MHKGSLTKLDWDILEHLQQNGRMTISELSSALGRSRSNISEHLEQLQDAGVLEGFTIKINTEKMGFGLSAFVRLQASSKDHRKIVNEINQQPEVIECHVLTGAELVIIRVVTNGMPHLRQFVDSLTQYGSTQTDIIFATVKNELTINNQLMQLAQNSDVANHSKSPNN